MNRAFNKRQLFYFRMINMPRVNAGLDDFGRLTIYSILPFTRYGVIGLNGKSGGTDDLSKHNNVNNTLFDLDAMNVVEI